jgi:hypothetical protein
MDRTAVKGDRIMGRQTAEPNTPEERQTALTVQSALNVLAELDRLGRLLATQGIGKEVRRRAKADLGEASERLCNLMALALYQISHMGAGPLQQRLSSQIDRLRSRLLVMGSQVMVEKLQKLYGWARSVDGNAGYPLGLASKLNHAYAAIVEGLRIVKGGELSAAEQQLIDATGAEIARLSAIEERIGVLVNIDRYRPARRAPVAA